MNQFCFSAADKHSTTHSRLKSELQYFTGDCSSNETQLEIKQEFINALNASVYNTLCRAHPGCGIDNVEVECGPIQTRRRKRQVTYNKRAISDRSVHHRHGIRSVHYVTQQLSRRFKRDYTHELFISFDFFIELRDEPDVSAVDKWDEIEATFDEVVEVTESNIKNGTLNLEIENFPMQLDTESFRFDESELYCPPGSIAQDDRFTCGTSFHYIVLVYKIPLFLYVTVTMFSSTDTCKSMYFHSNCTFESFTQTTIYKFEEQIILYVLNSWYFTISLYK